MKTSSFWEVIAAKILSSYATVTFVILWIGFILALLIHREWLDLAWAWAQGLPTAARIILWLVFTPVFVLLWIWGSSWPVHYRILGYAGIVIWTLISLYNFSKAFRKVTNP